MITVKRDNITIEFEFYKNEIVGHTVRVDNEILYGDDVFNRIDSDLFHELCMIAETKYRDATR